MFLLIEINSYCVDLNFNLILLILNPYFLHALYLANFAMLAPL